MDIFYNFDTEKAINISKIREIKILGSKALQTTFDNGDIKIYHTCGKVEETIEHFRKTIIQLIPCTSALYNVYSNEDGSYFHERVDYLALCVDGEIRTLSKSHRFFILAESESNFIGCFDEEILSEYPLS